MAVPHDKLTQTPMHLTYRLAGSVPKSRIEQLAFQRDQKLSILAEELARLPEHFRQEQKDKELFLIHGLFEMGVERALHDLQLPGPRHLNNPSMATIVLDSWLNMQERELVYIYAICVMSNHVHVIIRAPDGLEEVSLSDIVRKHKSFTAGKINKLIGRTGAPFWEPKYFDCRVRTGKFNMVMWYVLNNPVKAGLVKNWKDWPATYLNPDFDLLFRN